MNAERALVKHLMVTFFFSPKEPTRASGAQKWFATPFSPTPVHTPCAQTMALFKTKEIEIILDAQGDSRNDS